MESFNSINYISIIPFIILIIFLQWLRAYRWGIMLQSLRKLNQWTLFSITSVGFMAIILIPFRVGEFARPYLISQKEKISMSSAVATIVLERVLDGLTLMGFLVIVMFFTPLPGWVSKAGYLTLILFLLMLTILILLVLKKENTLKAIDFILKIFPERFSLKVKSLINSFVEGLGILPDVGKTLMVIFLSLLIWILMGFSFHILFFSFNFKLPLIAAYALLIIIALGVMIPAAPGFIGNFHFFCILGLTFLGISKPEAITFSIVLHFLNFSLIVLLGLIFLPTNKISLPTILKGARKMELSS